MLGLAGLTMSMRVAGHTSTSMSSIGTGAEQYAVAEHQRSGETTPVLELADLSTQKWYV